MEKSRIDQIKANKEKAYILSPSLYAHHEEWRALVDLVTKDIPWLIGQLEQGNDEICFLRAEIERLHSDCLILEEHLACQRDMVVKRDAKIYELRGSNQCHGCGAICNSCEGLTLSRAR